MALPCRKRPWPGRPASGTSVADLPARLPAANREGTFGRVAASGIINQRQVDVYADGNWLYPAEDREVMVLHTLTVDPDLSGRGIGRAFAQFYEDCARQAGCAVLRIDTNERNIAARHLDASLGYREADIVPCDFNRIPKIHLVLLEKKL